jgi:queuine tRNA-ribosyltransferase
MPEFGFKIEKKIPGRLGRAGIITTPHGEIKTPAFVTVGTKATVKALTPEMVNSLGAQVVLSNTYHLYLQPGDELVAKAGGLHKFMNWNGPMMTDSGGFQVFSLGAAFGEGGVSKFAKEGVQKIEELAKEDDTTVKLAKIDEDGVTFKSHIDGSLHRFTPERSMQIQHNLGADIIFAFDECTSPSADYDYQKQAMERTHRWAERSLKEHQRLSAGEAIPEVGLQVSPKSNFKGASPYQALFGIVQGGRHQDLREESARVIGRMDFDGFGIGGSFDKEDMGTAVGWVSAILPEDKPRHLLGIGEPEDILEGIKNGADTFDCVTPTRMARNGTLITKAGRLNILNAQYREDFTPIEEDCGCYTCQHYTRAYLAHLFRAKEMLAGTLASVHNLYYLINLTNQIREKILKGEEF